MQFEGDVAGGFIVVSANCIWDTKEFLYFHRIFGKFFLNFLTKIMRLDKKLKLYPA